MGGKPTRFLADFGGTHFRIGMAGQYAPEKIAVYKVNDWPDISTVLEDYAAQNNVRYAGSDFYLAHTGHLEDGTLNLGYKKSKPWSFTIDDIKNKFSIKSFVTLNDLEAMAYAPLYSGDVLFEKFREGIDNKALDCVVIGVGTGLGHAFLSPLAQYVRETFGGHFPPTATTDLQYQILRHIQAENPATYSFIFEDVVSGDGFFKIYQALASIKNTIPQAHAAQDVLTIEKDELVIETGIVFSEFLGIYAHILCNVAASYGGVYLGGGMFDRIYKSGLFNQDHFIKSFQQNMVPVVARALKNTPLYIATHEHVTLYGLDVFAREKS
jgi:glucokinase